LSLPKACLGRLKGENLIGQAIGERNGSPFFRGIKSLRVEPGAPVLEVESWLEADRWLKVESGKRRGGSGQDRQKPHIDTTDCVLAASSCDW